MRFAVGIPQQVPATGFDREAFCGYLARAEQAGFEGAWVQEQLLGRAPLLSPIEALCFAAACTERIRLGCAVLVTPLHSPVHLARELASLDQLSCGRLDVGVVAGGRSRPFAAFGLSPDGAVSRFTEGLAVLKALWTEDEVTFAGRFSTLESASVGLKPVQRPHPPIWLGGNHPDALRRAVSLGQGFVGAGSQPTSSFAEQAALVRRLCAERDVEGFQVAKRVYVAVDDDPRRARNSIASRLQSLYPRLSVEEALSFAVAGTPEECVEGLRAVADAGAGMIVLTTLYDEREQLERLAAEVVPRLLQR